jgi:hypothetical protein
MKIRSGVEVGVNPIITTVLGIDIYFTISLILPGTVVIKIQHYLFVV